MKRTQRQYVVAHLALGVLVVMPDAHWVAHADSQMSTQPKAGVPQRENAAQDIPCCNAGVTTPPTDFVTKVPKRRLHSPYPDYTMLTKDEDLVRQFRLPGCNECHGGTGGGGICPAPESGILVLGQHRRRAVQTNNGGLSGYAGPRRT